MTIPWQHNCPHQGAGWCLDCVAGLGRRADRLTLALTELLAAIEDSANPPDKDDVRAMLRYGRAEETARAVLAENGGRP